MPSEKEKSFPVRLKRFFLFAVFPLFMLPFIFLYSFGAWWLLTVLDGFPGGFFKQHPQLTAAVIAIFACFLFIATAQAMWAKMRARL